MAEVDLHHVSIIVSNTERSLTFYCDTLGLVQDDSRPSLSFPGAWLRAGSGSIHLLELPNPDAGSNRPEHGGRDRHIALSVSSLAEVIARLDRDEISYTSSKSGRRAVFCRDYDGNAVEVIEQ